MVRSKAVLAVVVVVLLAVVAVKVVRTPHVAAKTETPPVVGEAPHAATAAKATTSEVLSGGKLADCLKSGKPTLADFGEGWCEQCKKQAPVLEATATKYRGKANVVFVDTKAYAEIGQAYRITAIPTQIYFDTTGREISRHVGYSPPEDVDKALTKVGAK